MMDVCHVHVCDSLRQLENWVSESAATISSLGARDASVTEVSRIGLAWSRYLCYSMDQSEYSS